MNQLYKGSPCKANNIETTKTQKKSHQAPYEAEKAQIEAVKCQQIAQQVAEKREDCISAADTLW